MTTTDVANAAVERLREIERYVSAQPESIFRHEARALLDHIDGLTARAEQAAAERDRLVAMFARLHESTRIRLRDDKHNRFAQSVMDRTLAALTPHAHRPEYPTAEDRAEAADKRADALAAQVAGLREALRRLIYAAQGGNANKGNADLFRWLADRLVNVYGEREQYDYIMACRERAAMLDDALPPASEALATLDALDAPVHKMSAGEMDAFNKALLDSVEIVEPAPESRVETLEDLLRDARSELEQWATSSVGCDLCGVDRVGVERGSHEHGCLFARITAAIGEQKS